MFCSNCGTKLPEEANYCSNCGQAQKAGLSVPNPQKEIRYEYCEVDYDFLSRKSKGFWGGKIEYTFRFHAKAIGPKGTYIVAESQAWIQEGSLTDSFNSIPNKNIGGPYANNLVSVLLSDGWEIVEDNGWYQKKFRRALNT